MAAVLRGLGGVQGEDLVGEATRFRRFQGYRPFHPVLQPWFDKNEVLCQRD